MPEDPFVSPGPNPDPGSTASAVAPAPGQIFVAPRAGLDVLLQDDERAAKETALVEQTKQILAERPGAASARRSRGGTAMGDLPDQEIDEGC
eukprot:84158-Pyramimonas_sp.AAC.1